MSEVVGGKAVGLGSLRRLDLSVPAGFAVGTRAYREFVSEAGLDAEIRELSEGDESLRGRAAASGRIRRFFEERAPPEVLRAELARAYALLGEPPVAVRSSASSEDAAEASFAGGHETYLWIRGADAVGRAVVRCWGSLFTPQALAYFARMGVQPQEAAMGVVVQTMVPAEAAGVMLTLDPVTGDRSQITIEGSLGLGTAVVEGEVTPDQFFVDKMTFEIRSRVLSTKHVAYRFDPEMGSVGGFDVPVQAQQAPCVSDEEVVEIATLGRRVERALGASQDIEWAIGPGPLGSRQIYLLQTRAETVWSRRSPGSPGRA